MSVQIVTGVPLPPVNKKEVLRYAGVRTADEQTEARLAVCEEMLLPLLFPRACYRSLALTRTEDALSFGCAHTCSLSLRRALSECDSVLLFGATLGLAVDRLIARQAALSPATALLLDALAVERIEAFCDTVCAELSAKYAAEGVSLRPRFSPGYGDLPLTLQRDMLSLLELSKSIGITLNESLLMTPQKSVTAIIGIKKEPTPL